MTLSRRALLGSGGVAFAASLVGAPAAAHRPTPPIGVLLDVSGPTRLHGQRQRLGVEYMAERLAATSPVELRFLDTGGDPEQARAAAVELVQSGVVGLVGTSFTPLSAIKFIEAG